ncbi:MAG TPA: sigma factor [Planctomycetota bacterium]|jgi:DNA-directed RNA polymerase specialized sigma24 family protein
MRTTPPGDSVALAWQASPTDENWLAVEALVDGYVGRLLNCWAGPRDDLRQELMLAAFKAARSWRPGRGTKFTSYAIGCVLNAYRSALNASRKAGPVLDVPEGLAAAHDNPALLVEYRESYQKLLAGLVPRHAAALEAVRRGETIDRNDKCNALRAARAAARYL